MSTTELVSGFRAMSWSIYANEHRVYHKSIRDYLESNGNPAADRCDGWEELYEIQVYPDNPVGFITIVGPTLDDVVSQLRAWVAEEGR